MNQVVLNSDQDTPRDLSSWAPSGRNFFQNTNPALSPDTHEGLHIFSQDLKSNTPYELNLVVDGLLKMILGHNYHPRVWLRVSPVRLPVLHVNNCHYTTINPGPVFPQSGLPIAIYARGIFGSGSRMRWILFILLFLAEACLYCICFTSHLWKNHKRKQLYLF